MSQPLTRHSCGQSTFGGCDPDTCDRQCFTARVIELNRAMSAEQRKRDRLMLLAVGIIAFTISLIGLAAAADHGLDRAERQFQQDARI